MVIDVMCRASLRSCKKAPHNVGHAKQWRERHPNRIGADIGSGERLAVNVHWRLFIEPNPAQRLALEFLAAGKIAFQADYRLAAGDVIDFDAVEQVGNATRRDKLRNGVLRDRSRSSLAGSPNKHALHGIANDFASDTARPANGRSIKTTPRPPFGIAASSVDRRLKATRQCLAKLIAGHQQSLAVPCARSVEVKLFGIGLVISQPILS